MRLIGMLDSPYVRRTAIALDLLGVAFEHHSLSVFSDFDRFAAINPVVKAPTLVADDGTVLLDSTLIIAYAETLAAAERRLTPTDPAGLLRATRLLGLALAACEKTVQIVYETRLRPLDKQHQPWLDRVWQQLDAAYRLLEAEIGAGDGWVGTARPLLADVTIAVTWRFSRDLLGERIDPAVHPRLARLSAQAEETAAFRRFPPA
ncbi:MAG: hypothetical protein RLZZ501_338 [Pseudomonadota bacterium]|jgi:glutathione S-transferase